MNDLIPDTKSQIWTLRPVEDGNFMLINLQTGKAYDGNPYYETEPGIWMPFSWNPEPHSKNHWWRVEPDGDAFGLINVLAGKCLDGEVSGAKQADPAHPSPFSATWTKSPAQSLLWRFIPAGSFPVAPGNYYIQSLSCNRVIDGNTAEAIQFDALRPRSFMNDLIPGTHSQIWTLRIIGEATYMLINLQTGKAYDGNPYYLTEADIYMPFSWNPEPHSKNHWWRVEPDGDAFGLINVFSGKCLDGEVGGAKQVDPAHPSPYFADWTSPHPNRLLWRLLPASV
jgi:hypothetical protein